MFLNKLVQTLCVEDSFQKYLFYRFFPLFFGEVMQPTKKNMAIFIISVSKSTRNDVLFSFYATFHFNGHFRHFGRPY